jgi:hypothetical protein
MKNTTSRIVPVELSRRQTDSKTIRAYYKAGYGFASVISRFSEDRPIADLIYQIAQKQREIRCHEQHDG